MKLSIPATLVLIAASASAQMNPWFYQPLAQVKDFLQLTDSQLQKILTNNDAYNRFASTKQNRISQVQGEIADETSKETLDPMALGVRYLEIEGICREMKREAADYQQKNIAVLTDPQKAKMKVLEDAMKLAPVISQAQSGNLLGASASVSYAFTGSMGFGASLIAIPQFGGASGCYSPFLTMRSGDFSLPANRTTAINSAEARP